MFYYKHKYFIHLKTYKNAQKANYHINRKTMKNSKKIMFKKLMIKKNGCKIIIYLVAFEQ